MPGLFTRPVDYVYTDPLNSCLHGHFGPDNPHVWYIKPQTTNPIRPALRLVSVNPAEQGTMDVKVFDGPTLIDAHVVAWPTGGSPGDAVSIPLAIPSHPLSVYRVELTRLPPPPGIFEAHHYDWEMPGGFDIGFTATSHRYLEHNMPFETFQVHVAGGDSQQLTFFVESPDFGATQASTRGASSSPSRLTATTVSRGAALSATTASTSTAAAEPRHRLRNSATTVSITTATGSSMNSATVG